MIYHFFSRWKEIESEVFSIKKEIEEIERFYRIKIRLFKKIWDAIQANKIDFHNASRLLNLYNHARYPALYQLIISKISLVAEDNLLDKEMVNQFYEVVAMLKAKTEEQNNLAKSILEEMISLQRIPDASKFYALRDLLKVESQFLQIEGERFKKLENTFLIKKEPGADSVAYVHIFEAVKKRIVKFEGRELFIDGKPIQGITVNHNKISLKGDHYASMQNAKWIQGDRYLAPSVKDPFSYFAERGKMHGWSRETIQKALNCQSAEAVVSLEIEIFPEQLYIRVKTGVPVKFAIAQLKPEQVRKVIREAQAVA